MSRLEMNESNELDEIRQKKLIQMQQFQEQLHEQQMNDGAEQAQLAQHIKILEGIARQKLTKEAYQRYSNIKAVDAEKSIQLLAVLGQLINANPRKTITDEEVKQILMRLTPKKREFRIKRA